MIGICTERKEKCMTDRQTDTRNISRREKELAELIEKACSIQVVREFMEVYNIWQEQDRALDAYRLAKGQSSWTTATDSSSNL